MRIVPDRTEISEPLDLDSRLALRPAEAAKALGISERSLRTLLPRLPHLRLDGAVLLPVEALRRWLEEEAKALPNQVDKTVSEILDELKKD